MEKTKNLRKRKLVIALCSMLLCLILMGVTVYAALSQTATLTNTITVTQTGQAKTIVTVKEYANTSTEAITAVGAIPTFGAALNNDGSDDAKTYAMGAMVFDYANGKNYYAYEVTIENDSSAALYVKAEIPAESNTDVDVYFGTTWAGMEKATNGVAAGSSDTTTASLDKNGTNTYYIMVCVNKALDDSTLTIQDATAFNVVFTCQTTAFVA